MISTNKLVLEYLRQIQIILKYVIVLEVLEYPNKILNIYSNIQIDLEMFEYSKNLLKYRDFHALKHLFLLFISHSTLATNECSITVLEHLIKYSNTNFGI